MIFVLFVFLQCSDQNVNLLSKAELEQILIAHKDFKPFITIHANNIIALGSLEEEEENLLMLFHESPLAERHLLNAEINMILERIGYEPRAIYHYSSIIHSLDNNFAYSKTDLYEILDSYLLKEIGKMTNSRVEFPYEFTFYLGYCTDTCTTIAKETFPNDPTAAANGFTGCFKFCMEYCK